MNVDDRIRVIATEVVRMEFSEFINTICEMKHREVDMMRKKLDRIFTIEIGLLVGLVTTLIAVIVK